MYFGVEKGRNIHMCGVDKLLPIKFTTFPELHKNII